MDVTEGHARSLPPLDHRWLRRPHDRATLEAALFDGGVAGVASHSLDNVRANISMMIDGDPDKLFGLDEVPGDLDLHEVLGTDARPMNRFVSVAMVTTLGGIVAELVGERVETWVGALSLALALPPIVLAGARIFPAAVALGQGAGEIGRAHV